MKSTWNKVYTTVKPKFLKNRVKRRSANDHGEFQQQIPQRLVDGYKSPSSRNDRWRMRLKLIQKEYYFIGNQKS